MDEKAFKELATQLRKPEGEAGIKTGEFMNSGNRLMNLAAISSLELKNQENILEIGMGNGLFVNHLLREHPEVHYTGCDFSDTMISEAESRNAEWVKKGKARFLKANAEALPLPDATFEKIFTVNTIYFWGDHKKTLAEFYRLLKPDGKLVIVLRPKEHMQSYPFTKYGFKLFDKEDVATLLVENNFKLSGYLENQEPDLELNGTILKMGHLIVVASRN